MDDKKKMKGIKKEKKRKERRRKNKERRKKKKERKRGKVKKKRTMKRKDKKNRVSLVSLFNNISTFVGYVIPKQSLLKTSNDTI